VYGKSGHSDQKDTASFMPTQLTPLLLELCHGQAQGAEPAALVRVEGAVGSTPREAGAMMVVTAHGVAGTIGGGRLEWDAIGSARALLSSNQAAQTLEIALGPAIGQCCGGRVTLRIERLPRHRVQQMLETERNSVHPAVFIYGAGHVGRALAAALAPLPFRTTLIDSRGDELALFSAAGVAVLQSDKPLSIAENAPAGSAHVIMTHSHAIDSLIGAAVLEQNSFGYLGIIGSRTKRNSFSKAFREIGIPAERIARVVCPIGGNRVKDKRPEVIAALVAAELVETMLRKIGG
jgi:xanthine dehydrogenase accessory factor